MLATSPREFEYCNFVLRGFRSQRILFEVTGQGVLVSLHRFYEKDGVKMLLKWPSSIGQGASLAEKVYNMQASPAEGWAVVRTVALMSLRCMQYWSASGQKITKIRFFLPIVFSPWVFPKH